MSFRILKFLWLPSALLGCYEQNGKSKPCIPKFENIAYELPIEATNTCGTSGPTEYYPRLMSRLPIATCDMSQPDFRHGSELITDRDPRSWWQSDTLMEGVGSVNLTLNFGKEYDVTYIRLKFHSPRPDSFAIYKKRTPDGPWIPWQFYSISCESTYNVPRRGIITSDNEDSAICTDEYSDISPLTGGTVPFSTLEGRPSAFDYGRSSVLQDWVKASSVRISLTRLNTLGDEMFGEPSVLKSYYYAISDLSIGGRCFCNGHASSCSTHDDGTVACDCEHNTTGVNCERCMEGYMNYGTNGCEEIDYSESV